MLDLDLYTDPAAMRGPLQSLPGLDAAAIRGVVVLHAARRAPRRDPESRTCRIAVCYGVETGERAGQILYGKVYPSDVCAELAARADRPGAPAWLPELDMLLWRFPHDPGLPQLGALLDETTELVHYRPEERATLRRRVHHAQMARHQFPECPLITPLLPCLKQFLILGVVVGVAHGNDAVLSLSKEMSAGREIRHRNFPRPYRVGCGLI